MKPPKCRDTFFVCPAWGSWVMYLDVQDCANFEYVCVCITANKWTN